MIIWTPKCFIDLPRALEKTNSLRGKGYSPGGTLTTGSMVVHLGQPYHFIEYDGGVLVWGELLEPVLWWLSRSAIAFHRIEIGS